MAADHCPIVCNTGKNGRKRSKKHGPLHLVRVAMYMLRRSRNPKEAVVPAEAVPPKCLLHTIVSSVRLLHHENLVTQDEVVPPAEPIEAPLTKSYMVKSPSIDGMSSRYASAEDLKELDKESEKDENENREERNQSIDDLAEEFIANFYEQIRLQRVASIKRYNEMIANG